MFGNRFHLDIRGSGRADVLDEAIAAQLVHCIFYRRCRPCFGRADDDSVTP